MGRSAMEASPAMGVAKTRRACMSPVSSDDEFDFEPRKRARSTKPPAKAKRATMASTTSKRKKKAKDTKDGPPKFVAYLVEALKESVQAKLSFVYGFGLGTIVPVPEWPASETHELATWLEGLGFTSRTTKNTTVYRMTNQKAATLFKQWNPTVESDTLPASTKSYLHDIPLPLDGSLEFATAKPEPAPTPIPVMAPAVVAAAGPRWAASPILPDRLAHHRLSVEPSPIHKLSPQLGGDEHSLDVSFDDGDSVVVTKRMSFELFSPAPKKAAKGAISPIREEPSTDASLPSAFLRVGVPDTPLRRQLAATDVSALDLSRDDVVVQAKRARNHRRRLSRLDRVGRRTSFFAPSVHVAPQAVLPDTVATLVLSSGFLPVSPELHCVSKHWRKTCIEVDAWTRADYHAQPKRQGSLVEAFPSGSFLADGAYKRVYRVHDAASGADEAMSVMDIRSLEELGNEHIVRQEIAHSLLVSTLVASGKCPNFVRIHDVFLHGSPPTQWGASSPATDGLFQYVRMELCDGGNVEDHLRAGGALAVSDVVGYFFQMCFALYTGRIEHALRHYDIKLLNFFVQSHSAGAVSYAFN
ncbi:hypothetical protein ACHHYP_17344, partial [Achlya hypogyna]